ncbi:5'-methylthioadenosine/S-adenosylhomocysteine nucleosidase, partial [Candidatus Roizmanbacteria bacterium]|nr:5'-methylthioadenosine/S-adenosylhomocysteine nucleosidase [Candidatus Roizmanbacteria bacterium]
AAQWALLKFDPDHCINLGLVGGLNTELKIGEVMQVSACAFHDVDLTPFGYMHGQLPGSGLVKYELFSDSDQTYRPGTLITGDVFVDDKSKIEKSLQLHSPLALDMELASIAHTMHINKKLQKLRAYKAVSDYVNKESAGDYRGNADMFKQLQDLALKLIERA